MKTKSSSVRFLAGALLLLSLNACEYFTLTDYSQIEPVVELYPPEPLGDDAVILRAKILDRGLTGVNVAGFAYNDFGRAYIEDNQVAAEIPDTVEVFAAVIDRLPSGETVYFYAFAGTEEGYNGISERQEYVVP
ncbi:MAG: hypothetical protein AAFQ87_07030 [Bacteroidota bacterium]